MNPKIKLPLAALLAAGILAVAVTGCGDNEKTATQPSADHVQPDAMGAMNHGSGDASMQGSTGLAPGADGTSARASGLTLEPQEATFKPGRTTTWTLRVLDRDGMAVTRFERDQTKLMHLIVVRDDLSTFQHLHPALGAGGHLTVPVNLPVAGRYRAIADFTTAGRRYALGTGLTAPGEGSEKPLPAPSAMSTTDGYTVEIGHASLKAGKEADLTFTVLRAGKPVTGLRPYLGAFGHLVALHKQDLAYSHVHPVEHNAMDGTVSFAAEFPRSGAYRLFLQFRAGGAVHTAPFTVAVKE